MSTDTSKPLTPEEADHRAMLDHAFKGKPVDPDVARRVHERAEQVREGMRVRGVRIDAVELIRESREEL
jgi:hypothetical protein